MPKIRWPLAAILALSPIFAAPLLAQQTDFSQVDPTRPR